MNRETIAWSRIVVCIDKSTITILGQSTDAQALSLNRVRGISSLSECSSDSPPDTYKSVVKGAALIGFLELRGGTYLGVVTRASEEGRIGWDHRVVSIHDVEWIPIGFGINSIVKSDVRHISLISNLFKSGDFYFSESLNLDGNNTRFIWNYQHMQPFARFSPQWTVNIIHGGFRSLNFSSVNQPFQFVLIARRSRFFAGTRYRKRGVNWSGDCANEVETEQIFVQFGPPDHVCSFKQVRGSVPLHWSQDFHNVLGKPEIAVKNTDLELNSTKMHFENLMCRYGAPIVPVSLLLSRKGSTEASLGAEYAEALNQLAMKGVEKLSNFDLKLSASSTDPSSTASSSMFNEAAPLVARVVDQTMFTVQRNNEIVRKQEGIIRANCVDCLDRTSIFQYMVGLEVLNRHLVQLGLLDEAHWMRPSWACGPSVHVTPLLREIESLYDSLSDQLAIQYAGTAAHKKYSSGSSRQSSFDAGLINSGRELLISLSRHYSSTFTDSDKQNAINLFCGLYQDMWKDLALDEDVCAVDGIDKYVHAKTRHEVDLVQPGQLFQLKSNRRGREGGYEPILVFHDSKSLLFHPT